MKKHTKGNCIAGWVVLMALAGAGRATDRYVDTLHGSDANDGLTVATAKLHIQSAVNTAVAGDTVYLLPGTYDESFDSASTGHTGVAIRGLGEAIITRGANAAGGNVADLTFKGCTGALTLWQNDIQVTNCRFINNTRGLYCGGIAAKIRGCVFAGNTQCGLDAGSATVENCTFYGHWADEGAVAIALWVSAPAVVRNCSFVNNQLAVSVWSGSPCVRYCNFSGNENDFDPSGTCSEHQNDDSPGFINAAEGVFFLEPNSPLLTSGEDGRLIGALGAAFHGSKDQSPPWDGWIVWANSTAYSPAQFTDPSCPVELDPNNRLVLKEGQTLATVYSPVYDTGSAWTAVRSVDFGAFEDLTQPAGQRQLLDYDPNTPERELRLRTAMTSFAQSPTSGPTFEIVHKHIKFNRRAQYVQVELVLRRNGY